jgi:hypothetical protein
MIQTPTGKVQTRGDVFGFEIRQLSGLAQSSDTLSFDFARLVHLEHNRSYMEVD